jgi:hypothetical protein
MANCFAAPAPANDITSLYKARKPDPETYAPCS